MRPLTTNVGKTPVGNNVSFRFDISLRHIPPGRTDSHHGLNGWRELPRRRARQPVPPRPIHPTPLRRFVTYYVTNFSDSFPSESPARRHSHPPRPASGGTFRPRRFVT